MFDAARGGTLKPDLRTRSDIKLAVRVIGQAVATSLIVRASTVHRAVVLRHMEVDGPRAQCVGELRVGLVEFLL